MLQVAGAWACQFLFLLFGTVQISLDRKIFLIQARIRSRQCCRLGLLQAFGLTLLQCGQRPCDPQACPTYLVARVAVETQDKSHVVLLLE